VSSFAKSLFLGEIHEELVFPYPLSDDAEQDKIRSLIASLREFADEAMLSSLADPISDQVKELAAVSERALRKHGKDILYRQFLQKRLADAVADIYAQIAVLSRVTSISRTRASRSQARSATSPRRSARAAGRVNSNLRQVEQHDDDRMTAIAKLAYKRGNYGYALFED
jgi:hypothetical protein